MANGTVPLLNGLSAGKKIGTLLRHVVSSVLELRADHASLRTLLRNQCLTSAGLAIGTVSKAKVKIVNTTIYFNAGAVKSKATAEVAFTATTHDVTANAGAARERWYLIALAADGTPSITAGTQGAVGSGTFPATPAGETPIGLVRIEVAAGATDFDATTDELDEAHITDEYYNLFGCGFNFADVVAALSSTAPNSI